MTVANPGDDPDDPAEDVQVLELVDLDEPQDLGSGVTVDARDKLPPRPRRKRATDIPPPRRWPRAGARELRTCPVCHALTASVKEGFWHMQASHGGDTPNDVDMDEWGDDLQQEVQEYRDAIRGGRARVWRGQGPDYGLSGSHMAAALLAVIVVLFVTGVVYMLASLP